LAAGSFPERTEREPPRSGFWWTILHPKLLFLIRRLPNELGTPYSPGVHNQRDLPYRNARQGFSSLQIYQGR
jgi:hypothetical protein